MNLAQLFNRLRGGQAVAPGFSGASTPQEKPQGPAAPAASSAMAGQAGATVVPLREQFDWPEERSPWFEPAAAVEAATSSPAPPPVRPGGLLAAPELKSCLGRDHYASGRHHGSLFRTREALDIGRDAIVTHFQNEASALAERLHTRLDKLMLERQKVEGLSADMGKTLALAAEQVQREVDVLRQQIELAEQRKGWVLDALNRYQLGFDRGVRDALAYELLASCEDHTR
jgi:hypothetical protein